MSAPLSLEEHNELAELARAYGQRALSKPEIDRLYGLAQRHADSNPGNADALAWARIAKDLHQSIDGEASPVELPPPLPLPPPLDETPPPKALAQPPGPLPPPLDEHPPVPRPAGPATFAQPQDQRGWIRRHPVWTTISGVFVVLVLIAGLLGIIIEDPADSDSSRAQDPGGFTLLVSPFEDDSVYTAVAENGTTLFFEGRRGPDGQIEQIERLFIPGATERYVVEFDERSLVSRVERRDITTGTTEAVNVRFGTDTVTLEIFETVDARTPIQTESVPVSDIPGLAALLESARSGSLPGDAMDSSAALVPVSATNTVTEANAIAAASAPVPIEIETNVRTESGVPVEGVGVVWVVNMPLEFLDCVLLESGMSPPFGSRLPEFEGMMMDPDKCREVLSGQYDFGDFLQLSGISKRKGNGLYQGEVQLNALPLTADQIVDFCVEAADNWGYVGTVLGVLSLVAPVAGLVVGKTVAGGIGAFFTSLGLAAGPPTARDCVAYGRAREVAFDEPWTTFSMVASGRERKAPGFCVRDPDFARRSPEVTYTAAQLVATVVRHDIVLPDLLEVRVTGPGTLSADGNGAYTASRSGGTGPYEYGWEPSPAQVVSESDSESVGIFSASSLVASSGVPDAGIVSSWVEDSSTARDFPSGALVPASCFARATLQVNISGDKVATGQFSPPIDPGWRILENEIVLRFPVDDLGGPVEGEQRLTVAINLRSRGEECSYVQATAGTITGMITGIRDGEGRLSGSSTVTARISSIQGCEDRAFFQGTNEVSWSARIEGDRLMGNVAGVPFTAAVSDK